MVPESKRTLRRIAAVSKAAAAWLSTRLSVAALLGLSLAMILPSWILPFLAAQQLPPAVIATAPPARPVEIVRAVPVPLVETVPPTVPAVAQPAATLPSPAVAAGRQATILQVVAQRARNRRQAEREGESGALGKTGVAGEKGAATAPATPGDAKDAKKADPQPQPKAAATEPDPPEPDVWSDTEIIAALRDCLRRLAPLGADIEVAQPVKQERCGAPAPVVLKRVGSGGTRVELQPPAMLNCAMVASLHAWVEKTLQPAAQELLGSPVVRIRNVSGYVCRNRVGTVFHSDRLSEHALANAIDISAFVTADGRTVEVLKQWGPTARDLREQQERAAEAVAEAKAAAKEAESEAASAARAAARAPRAKREEIKAEAARKKEEAQRKRADVEKLEAERRVLVRTAELLKVGRGADGAPRLQPGSKKKTADAKGLTPVLSKDDASLIPSPEAAFLRRLHKGACGTFGTVLGPDANEAHRNHFHFDLTARKRSAFCE
jgi:hypothetical protein